MNLSPVIRHRYLTQNGLPMVGGQLFSYQAGTTTPQATYTDQTGLTPNSNPIILDANGEASVWLDPSLSYKFVLEDSNGVVQWTVDSVVGILTAGAVTTASLADLSVTSAKIANAAITSTQLQSDASVDANRPVNTNNIRDSAIIRSKLASSIMAAMNVQTFTSGTGTYNPTYTFYVTSANATAAATYSNNGQTFTVAKTVSGATVLQATGTGLPSTSGTLTKTSGTGDATIAFSAYIAPIYIRVRGVGAGGGGGGNATGTAGGAGGNTTFGTSLLTANGGGGGGAGGTSGAVGGSTTVAAPAVALLALKGGTGGCPNQTTNGAGSPGASTPFGSGGGGTASNGGDPAPANTGAGGGGGGGAGVAGGGGGAGGYFEAVITSPSTSYAYAVGAAGTAGGTSSGNPGGSGIIVVEEYFQ